MLVRKQVESLYKDTCTIYANQKTCDPETGITSSAMVAVYKDVSCRLSFSSALATRQGALLENTAQSTMLFINPEIDIDAGMQFEVVHEGRTLRYEDAGPVAIYRSHQEIPLTLSQKEA